MGDQQCLFRLVVSRPVKLEKPVPLVFAFHGFLTDSQDLMPWSTRLDRFARARGLIVVFPNALDARWRFGGFDNPKDDLAFFAALYQEITSKYNIDLKGVCHWDERRWLLCQFVGQQEKQQERRQCSSLRRVRVSPFWNPRGAEVTRASHSWERRKIVPRRESRVARDQYRRAGAHVELMEVEGLGQFWAHQENVNERMWKLFLAHP